MTRKSQREAIFSILFKLEFNGMDDMPEQIDFSLEDIDDLDDVDKDYITNKANNILGLISDIDVVIENISDGWKIDRLGKPELAIIRLAIYEIKYDDDIPFKVAINEAVELSKKYCNQDSKGFINAILGKLEE